MTTGRIGRAPGGEAALRQRIEAAPGMSPLTAHALAGFLEAEAHFSIARNNQGRTWSCAMQVALRDDDAPLLESFAHSLGIGRLCWKPARAGSRPQTAWQVSTKLECSVLAAILEEHRFRGRRRHQLAVWTQAVRLWSAQRYATGERRWRRLADLSSQIRSLRRYRPPTHGDCDVVSDSQEALANYFSGLFSGEGCFLFPKQRGARIAVKLRRDDRPLLEGLAGVFGIGTVYDAPAQPPSAPAAIWVVFSRRDLLDALTLFDSAPLWGRKSSQYLAWRPGAREIVRAWHEGRHVDPEVLDLARTGLRATNQYVAGPARRQPEPSKAIARAAYLSILKRWAEVYGPPFTCTRYEQARRDHPGWPKRETLSRLFGSWREGIVAAGLCSKSSQERLSRA
jgi:hypothetical protein